MKTTEPPSWRPPHLASDNPFAGLAPCGHLIVGVLPDVEESTILRVPWRHADPVLIAEVLDVGKNCPSVEVGNRVIIQRFSGAGRLFDGLTEDHTPYREDGGRPSSGLNPDWLGDDAGPLARFSAIQIVRCGNAIPAQRDGLDQALVSTAFVTKAIKAMIREGSKGEAYTVDDPKGIAAGARLATYERLLAIILSKRAGRAVNGAILAAGLSTGDDGAAFDGVLAVVET